MYKYNNHSFVSTKRFLEKKKKDKKKLKKNKNAKVYTSRNALPLVPVGCLGALSLHALPLPLPPRSQRRDERSRLVSGAWLPLAASASAPNTAEGPAISAFI
jgi:hypothetical protein